MIAIFGAPGAGKTVQGKMLARKYGWEWVSSRDMLLSLRDRDVTMALNNGMYIPDEKILQTMERVFRNVKRYPGQQFILDGFPSSVAQVYWMIEHGVIDELTGAIVLRVPRGELWRRLVERKRVDDTRAAIERRQDLYDRAVTGMIRTLSMHNVSVRDVDGRNTPEDVLERIEEVLGEWGLIKRKQFAKNPSTTSIQRSVRFIDLIDKI